MSAPDADWWPIKWKEKKGHYPHITRIVGGAEYIVCNLDDYTHHHLSGYRVHYTSAQNWEELARCNDLLELRCILLKLWGPEHAGT